MSGRNRGTVDQARGCASAESDCTTGCSAAAKRRFEGFAQSFELQHLGVRQPRHATFIDYEVRTA